MARAFCFVPNSSHVSQKQSAGCEVTIVWGTPGFFYEGFFKYVGMGGCLTIKYQFPWFSLHDSHPIQFLKSSFLCNHR